MRWGRFFAFWAAAALFILAGAWWRQNSRPGGRATERPADSQMLGTWKLQPRSEAWVERKLGKTVADSSVTLRPDGLLTAADMPFEDGFSKNVRLFSGEGRWELIQSGEVWDLQVTLGSFGEPLDLDTAKEGGIAGFSTATGGDADSEARLTWRRP